MNRRKQTNVLLLLVVALAVIFVGRRIYYTNQQSQTQLDRYVVVLSVDGFRTEYLERAETPALDAMAREGVQGRLIPCYPSNTFPNHYSMITGLHPQNSGLINNRFWAPDLNDYYSLGDKDRVYNPDFYWGEPIWNTAEKQGVKAASYFWVGSETAIQGMRPSYWKSYDGRVPFIERADSVLMWLQKPLKERPRMITWYLQEPDATGHKGTQSPELIQMVQQVDSVIGYFRAQLARLPIADQVDFIVVSDHGMTDMIPEKAVNLMDHLPKDSFAYVVEGAPSMLYTRNESYINEAMSILEKIPNISAYRRADVPERYHFNRGERIGDIVIIPDIGVQVSFRNNPTISHGGAHGFDNLHPDMEAIYFAVGQSFGQGVKVGATPNITIYPLVCRLLGITPAPNDASEIDVDKLIGK